MMWGQKVAGVMMLVHGDTDARSDARGRVSQAEREETGGRGLHAVATASQMR